MQFGGKLIAPGQVAILALFGGGGNDAVEGSSGGSRSKAATATAIASCASVFPYQCPVEPILIFNLNSWH